MSGPREPVLHKNHIGPSSSCFYSCWSLWFIMIVIEKNLRLNYTLCFSVLDLTGPGPVASILFLPTVSRELLLIYLSISSLLSGKVIIFTRPDSLPLVPAFFFTCGIGLINWRRTVNYWWTSKLAVTCRTASFRCLAKTFFVRNCIPSH